MICKRSDVRAANRETVSDAAGACAADGDVIMRIERGGHDWEQQHGIPAGGDNRVAVGYDVNQMCRDWSRAVVSSRPIERSASLFERVSTGSRLRWIDSAAFHALIRVAIIRNAQNLPQPAGRRLAGEKRVSRTGNPCSGRSAATLVRNSICRRRAIALSQRD